MCFITFNTRKFILDFEDKEMVWDIADSDEYYESNTRNIFNIPGVSEEISKKQERLTELRELQ